MLAFFIAKERNAFVRLCGILNPCTINDMTFIGAMNQVG